MRRFYSLFHLRPSAASPLGLGVPAAAPFSPPFLPPPRVFYQLLNFLLCHGGDSCSIAFTPCYLVDRAGPLPYTSCINIQKATTQALELSPGTMRKDKADDETWSSNSTRTSYMQAWAWSLGSASAASPVVVAPLVVGLHAHVLHPRRGEDPPGAIPARACPRLA